MVNIKIKLFWDYSKRKDGFMGQENRRHWMLTTTGNKIRITEKQYEFLAHLALQQQGEVTCG